MTNVSLRQRTRWIKRGRGKDSGGDGIKRGGEGEEERRGEIRGDGTVYSILLGQALECQEAK